LQLKDQFVNALVKEIELTTPYPGEQNAIETIYFGGGTPSILSTDDLRVIFDAINKKFIVNEDAEITLEANPDDITTEKLTAWKSIGINRLSIGIQSFQDKELAWMNRAHSAENSLTCIDNVIQSGFTNFSVDLIYGSPLLSDDDWKKNVDIIIQKNIPHISCYALTVEPKTALDKMIHQKKSAAVDPEKQAAQFLSLMKWMQQAGYEHYEISNFAKPGMRSKHNSSYWQGKYYYGFGPSAHSFDGTSRRWNIVNNALYIQSLEKNTIPFEEEILTVTQRLNEYIMTSLRTTEGIDLNFIKYSFGEKFSKELRENIDKHKLNSKFKIQNSKLTLINEGKLFADGIASDLFF